MYKKVISLLLSLIFVFSAFSTSVILAEDTACSEKMLYIKTSETWKELYQRAKVESGKTYIFSFCVSSQVQFTPICTTDNNRVTANADIQRISKVQNNGFNEYKYTYTIPSVDQNGNGMTEMVFIGIALTSATDGYFFNASVYDADDPNKTELFDNPDFSNGSLDGWAWGWSQWFGVWSVKGMSEWSNETTVLSLVDHDMELLRPTMLHVVNESIDMNDEILVQKIDGIEADTEYTVSLNRHFVSGFFNNQVKIVLVGDDGNSNTLYDTVIDFSADSDYIISTSDDGVNVRYTFKLDSSSAKYESYYAGFFFRKYASRMITEFYVSDFEIYKTSDAEKNNLFTKKSFKEMGGWYTYWHSAVPGSLVFDSQTVSSLDFAAEYVAYDATLFCAQKDVVHCGDLNFDGNIDIRDLVAMKKKIINSGAYISAADCNTDGTVDAVDLSAVRKHLIGTEPIAWQDRKSGLLAVNKLSGGADEAAERVKEQIAAKADTVRSERTYYVSADGLYSNSGSSESDAVNIEKLRTLSLSSGDAVLFKRGDVFRIGESIRLTSNVSYGAYGTGAKPQFLGSLRDYADSTLWTTDDGNIWTAVINSSKAGNIVFDGGEYVGVLKTTLDKVQKDGDFYFDSATRTVYLYLGQYNPGNYFESIEISSSGSAFSAADKENITLENLDIKYIYAHALHFVSCKGIKVTGCNIGWTGGGYLNGTARYGNGIEFWAGAVDCSVTDNCFYQIYDAAMTFQGSNADGGVYSNLTFTGNLVEYASMNFEFWDGTDMNTVSKARVSNVDFSNNILRFSGCGFSGMQREDVGNQAFILMWHYSYAKENITEFNIKNNIFDVARSYFYYASHIGDMVTVSDNTYYQDGNSPYNTVEYNTLGGVIYSKDKESFESAIKTFDRNPDVNWLGSTD